MYQKIIVPLDGSKLAECALLHAENLATDMDSQEIILVSVTESIKVTETVTDIRIPMESISFATIGSDVPSPDILKEESKLTNVMGRMDSQARNYLNRISGELKVKNLNVKTQVLIGNPANEIVAYADSNACDLIIMASHGRSGPSRWALGSVTDKVFRSSCVPVLMVRGPGCILGV